jgi:hypothetical protein
MTGREWNEFLDNGGFVERYGEEKVAPLRAGEEDLDGSRTPFVVSPIGDARNALMRSMDLIFPFGFLMMGLRFILRALLIFSGHIKPHFEGESGDDDREPDGSRDDADGEERAEGEVA